MNDDRPDQMTMIGLHKLADEIGGGMLPALYELLSPHLAAEDIDAINVMPFPADRVRLPRRSPHAISTIAHARGGEVLPFPVSEAARDERRKKQG